MRVCSITFPLPLTNMHSHPSSKPFALVQLLFRRIARHPTLHTRKRARLRVCSWLVPFLTANPCRPLGEGGRPRRAILTCVKVADYQKHKWLSIRRMCCEGCVRSKGQRCKHCPTPMCVDGLLQMIALSILCQTLPNL